VKYTKSLKNCLKKNNKRKNLDSFHEFLKEKYEKQKILFDFAEKIHYKYRYKITKIGDFYFISPGIFKKFFDGKRENLLDNYIVLPLPKNYLVPGAHYRAQYGNLARLGVQQDDIFIPEYTQATIYAILEFNKRIPLKGKKVLEIGCGRGDLSILAAKLGADVLAVDIDFDILKFFRLEVIPKNKFEGSITLLQQDILDKEKIEKIKEFSPKVVIMTLGPSSKAVEILQFVKENLPSVKYIILTPGNYDSINDLPEEWRGKKTPQEWTEEKIEELIGDFEKVTEVGRAFLPFPPYSSKYVSYIITICSEKLIIDKASKILSGEEVEKLNKVLQYFSQDYHKIKQIGDKIVDVIRKAPNVVEVYGIGYPFYGDVDIKKRILNTLEKLEKGEISKEEFFRRMIPDFDVLMVVDWDVEGPWSVDVNTDSRLREILVKYVYSAYRNWDEINKELQDVGLADLFEDRNKAVEVFFNENKCMLDILFVPAHIWKEIVYFVKKEDVEYFKFIRDILFTIKPNPKNSEDILTKFLLNYLLNILDEKQKLNIEELHKEIIDRNPYKDLIELWDIVKKNIEDKFRFILRYGIKNKLIEKTNEGKFVLTHKGKKYLAEIFNEREEIL